MSNQKKKNKALLPVALLGASYVALKVLASMENQKNEAKLNQDNPYQAQAMEDSYTLSTNFYTTTVKKILDSTLSFAGLVILSPVFAATAIAVWLDDPGPVFFTQKRVGKDKKFFALHKFRSMKMSTPHDVPTHMLDNPDQYITRVGKILRKTSLDELPQIWDIFAGNMSIIGPRPALWNQTDLIAERDQYHANDVTPGLTGWAQINGRDELEIPVKAKLDGDYVQELQKGSKEAFDMDVKCFFGTIRSVAKQEGVVEGGTGEMHKEEEKVLRAGVPETDPAEDFGYTKEFHIDESTRKKVLVTGAHSFIGTNVENWIKSHYSNSITVDTISQRDSSWKEKSFAGYDAIFDVTGIAHADVSNVSKETQENYYKVNTDLALETARKAKAEGVPQFIYMSSIIIYGESAGYGQKKQINEQTVPQPANFYGDSKWQADKGLRALADEKFHVAVVRPPMIYGRGSKGNYPVLAKLAKTLPVFPDVDNERSMLHIDNLCEFIAQLILSGEGGIYMPQNGTYTRTSEMVKEIAQAAGKHIVVSRTLNPAVFLADQVPGKVSRLVDKAFGSLTYDQKLSQYPGMHYQVNDLHGSIVKTEGKPQGGKKKALIEASVASMIDQFNMPNIELLQSMGYEVDVACNFEKGNTCTEEEIDDLINRLHEMRVDCYQIDFDRKVKDLKAEKRALEQLNKVLEHRAPVYRSSSIYHDASDYTFLHCQSPIGGVLGRIAGKNHRIPVIYTAHGFHFYDGAPKKNWAVFYPVEKTLSNLTDVLITINKEDCRRAKEEFHAGDTEYVPGVGIDLNKFEKPSVTREDKRRELGLAEDDIMILSVGELNANKNHETVINAIAQVKNPKIHYFIAGRGVLEEQLKKLAEENDVNLHLLGFRRDIPELLKAADLFALPSIREGLNVSLMEAMASGLPCVCGDIRGNQDLIEEGKGGFRVKSTDVNAWADAIRRILQMDHALMGSFNQEKIRDFSKESVQAALRKIYERF